MTRADTTSPWFENRSWRSLSWVWNERLPTYSFMVLSFQGGCVVVLQVAVLTTRPGEQKFREIQDLQERAIRTEQGTEPIKLTEVYLKCLGKANKYLAKFESHFPNGDALRIASSWDRLRAYSSPALASTRSRIAVTSAALPKGFLSRAFPGRLGTWPLKASSA